MNPRHPSDAAPSPIPPSPSHLAQAKTDGRGGRGGAAAEGAGPTARVGYGPSLPVLSTHQARAPLRQGTLPWAEGRAGEWAGTWGHAVGHGAMHWLSAPLWCSGCQSPSRQPAPGALWVRPSVRPFCSSRPSGLTRRSPPASSPWICFAMVLCFPFFAFFRPCLFYPNFWLVCLPTSLILFLLPFIFPPSLHSQCCPAFLFISCSRSHCVFFVVLMTTFSGIRKAKSQ